MKISNETLSILKNFASINTNIFFRAGNHISTVASSDAIFARATIKESIPNEFAVYDLNGLLSTLTLIENQEVAFEDTKLVISSERGTFEYFYSSPTVIVAAPDKSIEIDNHYQFKLSSEDVNMIMKAAAITSSPTITISSKGDDVSLTIGDKKNDTANTYKKVIGKSEHSFDCHMAVENFKIVPDAYTVTISKKKAFHFQHATKAIEYFIAMEPDSVV